MPLHLKKQISRQVQTFGLNPADWNLQLEKNRAIFVHRFDCDLKLVGDWIWSRKNLILKNLELAPTCIASN